MAAGCPHVKNLHLASDKSFLNPRTWACVDCGFTDSVWACLLCYNVACGRSNSRHALKHFEQTKHPIAVEVNHGYVHCYLCDDYVMTDNSSGDIALVQSLLRQVASQSYAESHSRSGRVIKPVENRFTRSESRVEAATDRAADKRYTALCHWRFSQLARAFNTWRSIVSRKKAPPTSEDVAPPSKDRKRKRLLTPGMTGLRNLGNTCYMNAVLQSLSHLVLFRECFRQLLPESHPPTQDTTTPAHSWHKSNGLATPSGCSATPSGCSDTPSGCNIRQVMYMRQTTVECFRHITTVTPGLTRKNSRQRSARSGQGVGLSGGRGGKPRNRVPSTDRSTQCMSAEMHALMRVLWSGKWAVVTPHAVLDAVWTLIPSFHGYTQQDAQEFLCELLLVLQGELDQWACSYSVPPPFPAHSLLPSLFQGHLLSKITYSVCGHSSCVEELFWDLSLDFPEKYQVSSKDMSSSLSLHEMLEKFIEPEKLEGKQYKCEQCSPKVGLQGAEKQFLIDKPPDVLRFHLKRFYWSSRDRHKISTHVSFPLQLDIRPYCSSSSFQSSSAPTSSTSTVVPSAAQGSRKTLSSVVIQPSKNPNAPPTPKVSFDLSSSVFTYPSEQSELRSSNARIQPVSVSVPVVSLNSKSPNHVSQPSPSSTSMISTDSEMKSLNREGGQSSLSGGCPGSGCPGNGCHGCTRDPQEGLLYHLSSVVVHHGAGFQSGHYTAYCWNAEAESWIHCNDARIMRCSEAELAACQAYILFYSLAQPANDCSGMSSSCEPVTKKRRLT